MFDGQEKFDDVLHHLRLRRVHLLMETAELAFRRAIEAGDVKMAILVHQNLQTMRSTALDALEPSGGAPDKLRLVMQSLNEVEIELINILRKEADDA
jgi:hypothetical protein